MLALLLSAVTVVSTSTALPTLSRSLDYAIQFVEERRLSRSVVVAAVL
jgi:hypothetical protein